MFQGVTISGVVQNFTVQKIVRRGAPRSAVAQLGAARRRHLRPARQRQDGAEGVVGRVSRSDQHRHAAEPERRTSTRRTPGTISTATCIFQPGNATWDGTKYVGGEFGDAADHQRPRRRNVRSIAEASVSQRADPRRRPRALAEHAARASPSCIRASTGSRAPSTRAWTSGRRSTVRSR